MAPKYVGELGPAALADPNNTHAKVLSFVGRGKRVLEIGSATGYMTRQLIVGQQCEVTALEIDEESAEQTRRTGAAVLIGSVESEDAIAQLDRGFDVVVMADVLEHLREPESVLSGLRSLLGLQGSLVLSVPNVAHWTVRFKLLRGQFEYTDKGILDNSHLRFFTRKSIGELLKHSGYVVDRFEAMYILPFHHRHPLGRLLARTGSANALIGLLGYQFIIEAKVR